MGDFNTPVPGVHIASHVLEAMKKNAGAVAIGEGAVARVSYDSQESGATVHAGGGNAIVQINGGQQVEVPQGESRNFSGEGTVFAVGAGIEIHRRTAESPPRNPPKFVPNGNVDRQLDGVVEVAGELFLGRSVTISSKGVEVDGKQIPIEIFGGNIQIGTPSPSPSARSTAPPPHFSPPAPTSAATPAAPAAQDESKMEGFARKNTSTAPASGHESTAMPAETKQRQGLISTFIAKVEGVISPRPQDEVKIRGTPASGGIRGDMITKELAQFQQVSGVGNSRNAIRPENPGPSESGRTSSIDPIAMSKALAQFQDLGIRISGVLGGQDVTSPESPRAPGGQKNYRSSNYDGPSSFNRR